MRPSIALVLTLLLIIAVMVGIFMLVYYSIESVSADLAAFEAETAVQAESIAEPTGILARIQGTSACAYFDMCWWM